MALNAEKPNKILILYNARSGHRQANFQHYLSALAELGAQTEVRVISPKFNLKELLQDASKFDRVVVAGGDGTVSGVAGVLQGTGIPIMAYPGGTANLLIRNLRIPFNPKALAEITLNGKAIRTDLAELEYVRYRKRDFFKRRILKRPVQGMPVKIYFAIIAGCGFAARLMSQAQPLKSRYGEAAYWISALFNLFPRRAQFRLNLDGKKMTTSGIGILAINFEKIQFDLKVVPDSEAQDGKIEIAVIKARSLFGLLPVLWGAIVQRLGFPRPPVKQIMETYQASDIKIECWPPLPMQFDGETLPKSSEMKIRVCPLAANFIYGESVQA